MNKKNKHNQQFTGDIVSELSKIGRLLSQQPNLNLLLETILKTSQDLLNADGATLYSAKNDQYLKFDLLRNTSLGISKGGEGQEIIDLPDIPLFIDSNENHKSVVSHTALTKKAINIPDAYHEKNLDFSQTKIFDKKTGYRTESVLAIPIINHHDKIIAVMQLINCTINDDVVPFSSVHQSIAEGLASQAGLAIENRLLIDQLSQDLAKEINDAKQYINDLLPAPIDDQVSTSWQYIPSSGLGGDAFGYHWIDDNYFSIYLLDVCGHGVGSALMSVSAMNVLRAQSLKNVNFLKPRSVLNAINNVFLMEDHGNKFFTLWYGVYDKKNRQLTYSSAGHPPAYIINTNTLEKVNIESLHTPNIAIGYMKDFDYKESMVTLNKYSKLYVFSDGVFEVEKQNKDMLSLKEFEKHMGNFIDPTVMESSKILGSMKAFNDTTQAFVDDYSFLEIIFR